MILSFNTATVIVVVAPSFVRVGTHTRMHPHGSALSNTCFQFFVRQRTALCLLGEGGHATNGINK